MNPTSVSQQELVVINKKSIAVFRKTNLYWLIFFINLFVCHTSVGDNIYAGFDYHGTMIAVYFDDGYIVIGADGKAINRYTNASREECKIIELGSHAFFSLSGINSKSGQNTGQPIFDSKVMASKIFEEGMNLEQSVSAWTNAMESEYAKGLLADPGDPFWRNDEPMVVGIFGGMSGDKLILMTSAINYDASTRGFTREIKEWPPGKRPRMFGATDKFASLANDFITATSDAAKAARRSLQHYVEEKGLDKVNERAKFAQSLINFVISASAGSIPEIGGEVSVLVAEKGKPVRWDARSPACAR